MVAISKGDTKMSAVADKLNALAKDGQALYHDCENFDRCKTLAVGDNPLCPRCQREDYGKGGKK